MKKKNSVSVTCNQTLALKKSFVFFTIEGEQIESLWNYCGKMFRRWKEVDNHIYEAYEPISSECNSKVEVNNYNEHIVVEI